MSRFLQFIIILISAFASNPWLASQELIMFHDIPDDSLYIRARDLAFEGELEKARAAALIVTGRNPLYHDANVLIARSFAWEGNYDSARVFIFKVTDVSPGYLDALSSLIDVELWSGNIEQALNKSSTALYFHPGNEELLLKKARALILLGSDNKASEILDDLLRINPDDEHAQRLFDELTASYFYYFRENSYLLAGYYGEFFEKPYERHFHMGSIGYSYYSGRGPLTGKLNFANTFIGGTGLTRYPSFQYEIESYPRISSRVYLLLNYAFSRGMVFPGHRGAFEMFGSLPQGFEASLGLRYLYWDKSYFFYTGSLGKYWSDLWFSFRPYIFPRENGLSSSLFFMARKYLRTADDFAGIIMGYGFSPDENLLDPADKIHLNTYVAGIEFSKTISANYLLRGSLRYEYEEFESSIFRNRWSVNLGVRCYL